MNDLEKQCALLLKVAKETAYLEGMSDSMRVIAGLASEIPQTTRKKLVDELKLLAQKVSPGSGS